MSKHPAQQHSLKLLLPMDNTVRLVSHSEVLSTVVYPAQAHQCGFHLHFILFMFQAHVAPSYHQILLHLQRRYSVTVPLGSQSSATIPTGPSTPISVPPKRASTQQYTTATAEAGMSPTYVAPGTSQLPEVHTPTEANARPTTATGPQRTETRRSVEQYAPNACQTNTKLLGRATACVVSAMPGFGMKRGLALPHGYQTLYIIDAAMVARSSFSYLKIIHNTFNSCFWIRIS